MNMKGKMKVIMAAVLLITNTAQSQDYTNLKFSSPLKYTPALTGLQNDTEINLRATHLKNYNSFYGDFSQYSKKMHGGFGVYLNTGNVNVGVNNFNEGRFSYAYQNKFNDKWNFSVGSSLEFSGGAYNTSAGLETYFNIDLSFGSIIYSDKFFASLAINDYFSWPSLNLGVGREFTSNNFSVTPSVNLSMQNSFLNLETNVAMRYKNINLGVGFNYNRLNGSVGYDFEKIRVNYNFGNINGGIGEYNSHELSVKFKLNNGSAKRSKFKFNLF